MILRTHGHRREGRQAGGSGAAAPAAEPQSIDGWLDLLTSMLHISEVQKRAIRDELDAHLHERMRDLMIGGCREAEAFRRAVAEMGEAARLAQQFQNVNRGRIRRTIMHFSILGISAGAVIAASVMTFNAATNQVPISIFQPPETQERAGWLDEGSYSFELEGTLGEAFRSFEEHLDRTIDPLWNELADHGFDREREIVVRGRNLTAAAAVDRFLRSIEDVRGELAWRVVDDQIVIGTSEGFDIRERVLVSYDVADTLWSLVEEHEEPADAIATLIGEFVEPELWEMNGGIVARLRIVGGRMFIEAPDRMHQKVRWILSELASEEDADVEEAAVHTEPDAEQHVRVIPLGHTDAADLVPVLNDVLEHVLEIHLDASTNSLIIRADGQDQDAVHALIRLLDRRTDGPRDAEAQPDAEGLRERLAGANERIEELHAVMTEEQMRRILAAAFEYADTHDGWLPERPSQLVDILKGDQWQLFIAPYDLSDQLVENIEDSPYAWLDGYASFELHRGRHSFDVSQPVVTEKRADEDGRRWVFYADGHGEQIAAE